MRHMIIMSTLSVLAFSQACTQSSKKSTGQNQSAQLGKTSNETVDANTFITANAVTGRVNNISHNLTRGIAWIDQSGSNRLNIKLDNIPNSNLNFYSCSSTGGVLENGSTNSTTPYVAVTINAPLQVGAVSNTVAQSYPTISTSGATVNFSYRQAGMSSQGDNLLADQNTNVSISSVGQNVVSGSFNASASNNLRTMSGTFRVYLCRPGDSAKIIR